ncbi:MAG: hypothetical protein AVDCRST_MAG85-1064, partial [uncultured Solirubrobacteraceae bacterium]
ALRLRPATGLPGDLRPRRGRDLALPDLPAAPAHRLGAARGLPRACARFPRELPRRAHEARVRDHHRLPRPACDPDHPGRDHRPADRQRRRGARPGRAALRRRPAGVRQRERAPARARRRLRHHRAPPGGGRDAACARGRRREHPRRHRHRPRQLDLRARDDPRPDRVHPRQRAALALGLPRAAARAPPRSAGSRDGPHRQGRLGLRRRRGADRADRRHDLVHRDDDPRRAVRGPAGRVRGLHVAHPAHRRDDRRGRHRPGHAVQRLPDRHDHLDGLGDHLPAAREQPRAAADPEAHGRRAAVHRPHRGAVRLGAARGPGSARRDPDRGVDPDQHPRVVALAPRGARASRRDARASTVDASSNGL